MAILSEKMQREFLAKNEYLDNLVHSRYPSIRYGVAQKNIDRYSEILAKDKDEVVRRGVAENAPLNILKKMINDESWQVRYAIANRNIKELNELLLTDSDWMIKSALIRLGADYILNYFKYDKDPFIRQLVALYGRAQDLIYLAQDSNENVKHTVKMITKER